MTPSPPARRLFAQSASTIPVTLESTHFRHFSPEIQKSFPNEEISDARQHGSCGSKSAALKIASPLAVCPNSRHLDEWRISSVWATSSSHLFG
jgi:hypothetical protein